MGRAVTAFARTLPQPPPLNPTAPLPYWGKTCTLSMLTRLRGRGPAAALALSQLPVVLRCFPHQVFHGAACAQTPTNARPGCCSNPVPVPKPYGAPLCATLVIAPLYADAYEREARLMR